MPRFVRVQRGGCLRRLHQERCVRKNVFKSFAQGVVQFAASFAAALAQINIKTLAFTAALFALSAITHIPMQLLAAAATAGASVHHAGGIAGSAGGVKRSLPAMMFAGASRFHTGGIAGLAPDELRAILQRGEEVLTKRDPPHRANGGLGGGAPSGGDLTVINVADHDAAVQAAPHAGLRFRLDLPDHVGRRKQGTDFVGETGPCAHF